MRAVVSAWMGWIYAMESEKVVEVTLFCTLVLCRLGL